MTPAVTPKKKKKKPVRVNTSHPAKKIKKKVSLAKPTAKPKTPHKKVHVKPGTASVAPKVTGKKLSILEPAHKEDRKKKKKNLVHESRKLKAYLVRKETIGTLHSTC